MIRFIATVYKMIRSFNFPFPLRWRFLSSKLGTSASIHPGKAPQPLPSWYAAPWFFMVVLVTVAGFITQGHTSTSSISTPDSPQVFWHDDDLECVHYYTPTQVRSAHDQSLQNYLSIEQKYKAEQSVRAEKEATQKVIKALLKSHKPDVYALSDFLDYKDPQNPLTRVHPRSWVEAGDFIQHSLFIPFVPLLSPHAQAFVAQAFQKWDKDMLQSFRHFHDILTRSYKVSMGIRLAQLGDHPSPLSAPFQKDFEEKLTQQKKELLTWLHQYHNPESPDLKGKDKERDQASKKLGVTRATLQYVIQRHLNPPSFTWNTWINQHLLSSLIPAVLEQELFNFLSRSPEDITPPMDTLDHLETARQQLEYWTHLKTRLESSSSFDFTEFSSISSSVANVFDEPPSPSQSESPPTKASAKILNPNASSLLQKLGYPLLPYTPPPHPSKDKESSDEDYIETPDSMDRSIQSQSCSSESSFVTPDSSCGSFPLFFTNHLYTAHPQSSPSPLQMKINEPPISEQPKTPKEEPLSHHPSALELVIRNLRRALSIPSAPTDFVCSAPDDPTEEG
ncbi:MAG: hypothetical protein ACK5PQ_02450 [Alphaproteobacteria bacterium]